MRRLLAVAVMVVAASATAEAQIYSWRDANGTLVLSDRPLHSGARTFAVGGAGSIRATRPRVRVYRNDFDALIDQHAALNGIRPDLVRAVIQVESGYNRYARSRKGALGLMQLMPATAAEFGVVDAFSPAENIRAGAAYLRQLLDKYDRDEELALAAYNAGPGAVERYGHAVPPYRETRDYVNRVQSVTGVSTGRGRRIYKTIEMLDGRPVPRYSDKKPASGPYEVILAR